MGGSLYHAILAARIGMLTQELELLKNDREDQRIQLETEKREARELRLSLSSCNNTLLAERSDHVEQIAALMQFLNDDQKLAMRKVAADLKSARANKQAAASSESTNSKPLSTRIVS